MILNAQQYDFNLVYKPGKDMHIADLLSRAHLKRQEATDFDFINAVDYVPIRSKRLTRLKKVTQEDESLQILITVIQEGWPDDESRVPYYKPQHIFIVVMKLQFMMDRCTKAAE